MMPFAKHLLAITLPLTATLVGCTNSSNGVDELFTTSSVGKLNLEAPAPHISSYSIARQVSKSSALIEPSSRFGEILEVSETRFVNGVTQRISLSGRAGQVGENWISISLSDGRRKGAQPNVLLLKKPTARSVSGRLKRHFPNRALAINAASFSNAYGVFGTAHNRRSGVAGCHYGWQFMQPHKARGSISWPNWRKAPKAALVEVRMCRQGMTAEQFAALMNEFRLDVPADVLTARQETLWSSGTPLNNTSASDLVGTGLPAQPSGAPLPQVVAPEPVAVAVPAPKARKKATPKVQAKPLPKVVAKTDAEVKTSPVPMPTEVADLIRPSNRIAAADAPQYPTVPLPQ